MKKIAVMLADGFEEIETITPIDLLRRAGAQVITVGNELVKGSRDISVASDMRVKEFLADCEKNGLPDAVVIPGGLNGTKNLAACTKAQNFITKMWQENKLVCAICAAPSILGHKGLLDGKEATCFPGFEEELSGAKISKSFVVKDGNFITAKGMGSAIEFGLQIAEILTNPLEAKKIRASLQIYNG
jgi:4-methyl-5(b-hydroxyethyl)-thiazole monophosphate biosynthesis